MDMYFRGDDENGMILSFHQNVCLDLYASIHCLDSVHDDGYECQRGYNENDWVGTLLSTWLTNVSIFA